MGVILIGVIGAIGGGIVALILLIPILIALPIFYHVYFVGNERGQTYGRRAVGIQVRHESSLGPVGYGRAFGRYLITFVFGIFTFPLILDYLWPLWDARNQTLHDKAASTVVVRL